MDFRLLVKASDESREPSFTLEGSRWTLSSKYDLDEDSDIPPFVCISYRWGLGRKPHPLNPELSMSDYTLPSLAAAIRCAGSDYGAFWTDVFCVPPEEGPDRQATLENMGYIYSRAEKVVVVLNQRTLTTIQNMARHGFTDEDSLRLIEQDDWASSVWTYQEIVNSKSVIFTCEGRADGEQGDDLISAMDLLNAIGFSLVKWQKLTCSSNMKMVRHFPNLSLLEDLLLDYQTGALLSRTAFLAFSSLAYKQNSDTANYFYAILGTLTASTTDLSWRSEGTLADKVMAICESRNEFSYIYTVADRDTDPQRRWRPASTLAVCPNSNFPMVLRPVLVWHCWGDGQLGHRDTKGLWLHNVSTTRPSAAMEDDAKSNVSRWLQAVDPEPADLRTLAEGTYDTIVTMGFLGAKEPLVTPHGFVFATERVDPDSVLKIVISNDVRWTMGAPGLVSYSDDVGEKRYVACAFIGAHRELSGDGETVLLD